MIKLEQSKALERIIRKDDPADLGKSSWALAVDAIRAGRTEEAIALITHEAGVFKRTNDSLVSIFDYLITKLSNLDEESVEPILKERFYPRIKHWLSVTPGVEESMQVWIEHHRGHQSNISVVEEKDKYVVTLDPCGSGGRLRMTTNAATVKRPHPWSWGKAGVPIYCTHCCVTWEVIATELRGYPIKVAHPGATAKDPCIHFFYKRPELIPEEYFTRIGKTKTIK